MSAERADRLAERLAGRRLDALLVTHMVNVRYLTGFSGTNGLAIVGAGEDGARVFVTDFRYVERAAEEVEGYEQRRGGRDLFDAGCRTESGAAAQHRLRLWAGKVWLERALQSGSGSHEVRRAPGARSRATT